jgi:hypothetical protein
LFPNFPCGTIHLHLNDYKHNHITLFILPILTFLLATYTSHETILFSDCQNMLNVNLPFCNFHFEKLNVSHIIIYGLGTPSRQ